MKKEAVIIGYSGHAFVLVDILLANGYHILGYCDKEKKTKNPYKLNYLGNENETAVLKTITKCDVFLGIGNNEIRALIFEYLTKQQVNFPPLIYNASFVSLQTQIGMATIVMPGVVINSQCKIGNAVICNSSSIIEHECTIGDYSHIAPGAVLAGNVMVGKKTFIGANAVIKQGIKIGDNAIIGAGAVVVKDVPKNLTVYGNPAKTKTA